MDKAYWQEFYKEGVAPSEASLFAQYVAANYLKSDMTLVELGCGNGRDAIFFGSRNVQVTAIDQVDTEIKELSTDNRYQNVTYVSGDFTKLDAVEAVYDVIYSRFTLHSVSLEEQRRTLQWAEAALKPSGYLCIEARGQKNGLYKKGQPVPGQPDAFVYDDHYRRFINKDDFDSEVTGLGLGIIASNEAQGYAPFGDNDDFFIRQISQKPGGASLEG